MRPNGFGPVQPETIYLVYKPYGASLFFTEPGKVCDDMLEVIKQGNPPVVFKSLKEAIASQRCGTLSPDRIDAFSVVSIDLDPNTLVYLAGESLTLRTDEDDIGYHALYKLTGQSVELLREVLLTPGYIGLQMRLITAESAARLEKTQHVRMA